MFDISPEKLLVIGVIATVVLGPDRLPKAAHALGRALHGLKRMTDGYQSEVNAALREPRDAVASVVDGLRQPHDTLSGALREVRDSARGAQPAVPVRETTPSGPPPDQASVTHGLPDSPSLN